MKKISVTVFILCAFLVIGNIFAEEVIRIQKGGNANPSLRIGSAQIPADLQKEIERMFKVANWFDVTSSGGDYVLEMAGNANRLDYRLRAGSNVRASGRIAGDGDNNKCAKMLVDDILRQVFKVPVLCQSKIVFSYGDNIKSRQICISDIDGKNFEQITSFKGLSVEPIFAPNGRSVVYSSYRNNQISIFETILYPRRTRKLSSFDGLNSGAAVAPNGRFMAMILSKDKQVDLYLRDLRTGNLTRLTRDKAVESSPCFSPDGKYICFLSDKSGVPKLYVTNLSGSQSKLMPSVGREAYTPDWSTDNRIAYITRVDGEYRIAILEVSSGRNALVPNLTGRWESPSWAPDNRHIVCSKADGPMKSSLYVIDSKTGNCRKLFSNGKYFSTPNWSKVAVD